MLSILCSGEVTLAEQPVHFSLQFLLREERSLVDMFVLEMLVVFISSLKLAHRDSQSCGETERLSTAVLIAGSVSCVRYSGAVRPCALSFGQDHQSNCCPAQRAKQDKTSAKVLWDHCVSL